MSNDRNGSYRGSRSPSVRSYSKSRSRSMSRDRDRGERRRSRSGSYRVSSRRRSPSPYSRRYGGGGGGGGSNSGAPDRLNPPPSNVLGVFGLGLHTTERDLKDVFGKYGKLTEARLIIDKRTNRSRGFGFVYFEKVDDAKEAKRKCHGLEVDGKIIRVDYSIGERDYSQLPPRGPSRYRYGGGGGGRRYDRSPYDRSPGGYGRRERGSPVYKRYSRSRSRSYDRGHYRRSSSYRR